MLILYLSGREVEYTRNDVLVRALKRFATVDVLSERGPGRILFRSLRLTLRALPSLVQQKYDLVVVGFYGHLLMLPVGLFYRGPVLFDAFISTYDTLVQDRGLVRKGSPIAYLARWLDQIACRLSDHILLDTPLHAEYFKSEFGIAAGKLTPLPVSCNEDLFSMAPLDRHEGLVILYYCTYLPLHGADVVVEAAARLKENTGLRFRLIGAGPAYRQVRSLADKLGLSNLEFVPPVTLDKLAVEISQADICLGGHFGSSDKAARVVPGKIYQILSMGRPLIAAQTPANAAFLVSGEHALLCQPGDPAALAASILILAESPEMRVALAAAGRERFQACCSEGVITQELARLANQLVI